MPKFRKKPVEVEAEQFFPDGRAIEGVIRLHDDSVAKYNHYVITIHKQRAYLAPGDWVIKESDGIHHYPCKPDIFEATYEPEKI